MINRKESNDLLFKNRQLFIDVNILTEYIDKLLTLINESFLTGKHHKRCTNLGIFLLETVICDNDSKYKTFGYESDSERVKV